MILRIKVHYFSRVQRLFPLKDGKMTEIAEKEVAESGRPAVNNDVVLAYIVSMVNKQDMSLGITLCVKGLVVSGILIGGKQFFEGIAHDLGPYSPFFAGIGEGGAEAYKTSPPDRFDALDHIEFIHLKDARVMSGNTPLPGFHQPGTYWRGRLQSVDGFYFGNMEENKS